MAKKREFIMKQRELGRKILELRKAKGFTQEELVIKCNINVRTIQRIEAGEVTPRSYTVKIILEALGYDLNTIQVKESENNFNLATNQDTRFLKTAFFMGIVYFALAFVEVFLDMKVWGLGLFGAEFNEDVSFVTYFIVKFSVVVTFGTFMLGYFRLSNVYPNAIIKTTSVLLAVMTMIAISIDLYSFYTRDPNEFILPVQAVSFGIVDVVFAIGMMKYRNVFGTVAFIGGVVGIACGAALMSVVMALPGLALVAVFEILQLIMLYQAIDEDRGEASRASVV
jgi:transcriptional regulator with XRE-family HTH domain